jgi:hypothetical protein
MKNLLKYLDIKTILIILLGVALLLTTMCSHNKKPGEKVYIAGKPYEVLKHTIDTQYYPKEKLVIKKGDDIYHDKPIYVPIPSTIDTMEVVRNYFAKNTYKDTLQLGDTFGKKYINLGMITTIDTIQKNKILKRTWHSTVNLMKINELLIVKELPKRQVYIGFDSRLNTTDIFNAVGADVSLKSKKDVLYNVSVGVANTAATTTLTPYVGFGMQWKIKLW